MEAEIISVGDEIVQGMVVDTNAAFLSTLLAAHGIAATRHQAVGDDLNAVAEAVAEAGERARLVIVNGGIGPTVDDVTRQAVAKAAGETLRMDNEWLVVMQAKFQLHGVAMPPTNEVQALIPENATRITNPTGTAAGFHMQLNGAEVAVFPGVPAELMVMFRQEYLPGLLQRFPVGRVLVTRRLQCFGTPESLINEKIQHLMGTGRNPTVGLLATDGVISVKITAEADDETDALESIDAVKREVRELVGECVFGEDDDELQTAVARLLTERGLAVCTAESCTGGLIAQRLTEISGSSRYFLGGVVTYSNEAKISLLGVPANLFDEVGAVSYEVAAAMAENARKHFGADYAISVTGIAGPTGGTREKPVGLIYIGIAGPEGTRTHQLRLSGDRAGIRDRTAKHALNFLLHSVRPQTRETQHDTATA